MPVIPLWMWLVGGAATVGTVTVANKVNDFADPLSPASPPPVSGVTATLLVAGGVFFLIAKKQKWI